MRARAAARIACLALGLCLALPSGVALAQVKPLGSYPTKKLKDGGKNADYLVLAKDGWLRFQARGPQGVVVLVRTEARGEVVFELELDEGQVGQVRLKTDARISRGFFVNVPKGAHEVGIQVRGEAALRLLPVKRKPMKDEAVVAWRARPPAPAPVEPAKPAEPPPPPEEPKPAVAG